VVLVAEAAEGSVGNVIQRTLAERDRDGVIALILGDSEDLRVLNRFLPREKRKSRPRPKPKPMPKLKPKPKPKTKPENIQFQIQFQNQTRPKQDQNPIQ
jgi:hypothetical protein